ncbi:hypothetical protein AcW1_006669 [Taiwanofungus camphoratus]|nr:hypothetical protein AcW2_005431 [Antrodia cinnamomea]KAI0954062.1 hypothetical protein AcV7_007402 [Antrodia cinnamomea]KAI0954920.1 hypothetical protein AcW1_006669 [Antrodia cinnamomea]
MQGALTKLGVGKSRNKVALEAVAMVAAVFKLPQPLADGEMTDLAWSRGMDQASRPPAAAGNRRLATSTEPRLPLNWPYSGPPRRSFPLLKPSEPPVPN